MNGKIRKLDKDQKPDKMYFMTWRETFSSVIYDEYYRKTMMYNVICTVKSFLALENLAWRLSVGGVGAANFSIDEPGGRKQGHVCEEQG